MEMDVKNIKIILVYGRNFQMLTYYKFYFSLVTNLLGSWFSLSLYVFFLLNIIILKKAQLSS